jgi:hypothetical protein
LTSFYAIAGRSFCIQALDDRSARLAAVFLSEFRFTPIQDHPEDEVSYTIRVRSEAPPPEPPGLETFEVAYGHCHTDGIKYYLFIEDSLVLIGSRDSRVIDVWLGDSTHARLPTSVVNVMSYAMEGALRRCSLYQLHGAGIIEPEGGMGALVIGASGSGKTTVTMHLAASGWYYLTDDALIINERAGMIEAQGTRRIFAVTEKTIDACEFPQLMEALGAPVMSDPSKRRLEPGVAFPDRLAESCIPEVLFFVSISGEAESRISSLSRGEAMTRLIKFNPWASYDTSEARGHLHTLGELVRQCRAYTLDSGLDILNEPGRAASILSAYMKR